MTMQPRRSAPVTPLAPQLPSLPRVGAIALVCVVLCGGKSLGQVFERSVPLAPAEVERMDPTAATHLENAERFLAEKQWDEAIEAIRRVMEGDTGQFVAVEQRGGYTRWIPVRQFCQQKLAALAQQAPEALARYRALVDPLAEQWYREAVAERREDLLRRIIDQALASKWTDDALLLAGEFRLEAGDHAAARNDWQRISPLLTVPPQLAELRGVNVGSPLWLAVRTVDWENDGEAVLEALAAAPTVEPGVVPDTDLGLANVRARLVLVSILEGSLDRAAIELDLFRRLNADAEGQLGGRRGKYVDLLSAWLDEAKNWPSARSQGEWPTFAGNWQRNAKALPGPDIAGKPTWSHPLPRLTSDREVIGASRLRPADDMKGLLSYFPVVVGDTVLLRSETGQKSLIAALDLTSGEVKWEVDYARRLWSLDGSTQLNDAATSDAHQGLSRHVGVARFTLSAADGKVFSRMGSPVSGPSDRAMARLLSKDQGWLAGLDLRSEGKPLEGFPIRPESSAWAFEGTPIYDRGSLYVAMRRADGPRTQMYVACFDLPTGPTPIDDSEDDSRPVGRMKWRTKVASGATIRGGDVDEIGNTLLTLSHGKVYCNTNLGAVASLNADNGKVDWVVTYPRATFRSGNVDRAEDHFFRDLTPCMIAKDLAVVAPMDGPAVFAVERCSGRVIWSLAAEQGTDIVHLIGSTGNVVHASGDALYWIDLQSGRIVTQYPHAPPKSQGLAPPSPRGFGRGIVAGDQVYWPTRDSLYVFAAQPVKTDTGWRPQGVRDISLVQRGATGGNLTIAGGVLLIAGSERLYAFDEQGPAGTDESQKVEIR